MSLSLAVLLISKSILSCKLEYPLGALAQTRESCAKSSELVYREGKVKYTFIRGHQPIAWFLGAMSANLQTHVGLGYKKITDLHVQLEDTGLKTQDLKRRKKLRLNPIYTLIFFLFVFFYFYFIFFLWVWRSENGVLELFRLPGRV